MFIYIYIYIIHIYIYIEMFSLISAYTYTLGSRVVGLGC